MISIPFPVPYFFVLVALLAGVFPARALDLYLSPDTLRADPGQTVTVEARIGASAPLRGFTVYLTYDTSLVRLAAPVQAGALIASQDGLEFHYFDHTPTNPGNLEIGGTVFGDDLWSGPGILFRAQFQLRDCGDAPITYPYPPFFLSGDGGFPQANTAETFVEICRRIPLAPEALTINDFNGSVRLRWNSVSSDTVGRPLPGPAVYTIYRTSDVLSQAPVPCAQTTDTIYVESDESSHHYFYYVTAQN